MTCVRVYKLDCKVNLACNHSADWRPPQVSASFHLRLVKARIGIIIRNHLGAAIATKAPPISSCNSVELLEAKACLEGMQLALDLGLNGVMVELDAAEVVNLISDKVIPHSEMGALLSGILSLSILWGWFRQQQFVEGPNLFLTALPS
ncbi:hypothetical protein Dsin_030659 [Dipteronia sinensis]|uniref:RNase H type-1 domain-containing protein n=1 Tax=Dipteronia sinensis TaxID=43782 RepID=A0AAD9ZKG8_9ROSI|nr:hypothetical protein Dsin_030659 [Dipteronia sinensis]